jgi:hypothetical protein
VGPPLKEDEDVLLICRLPVKREHAYWIPDSVVGESRAKGILLRRGEMDVALWAAAITAAVSTAAG